MTRVVVRILTSLLCVPAIVVLCALLGATLSELRWINENTAVTAAFSLAPLMGIGAWLIVWNRMIRWTPRRRLTTAVIVAAVAALDLIAVVGVSVVFRFRSGDWSFAASMLNLLIGTSGWIACLWVWSENPRERFKRMSQFEGVARTCPACRYDMSGLTNLRCPECGGVYTLGQIEDAHRRSESPADFN